MIGRILSFIPAIPSGLLLRAAAFLLYTAAIYGLGNVHATERVMKEQEALMLQESADRQRENHLVLFEEFRRRNAEYKAHIEQQIGADAAAYAMLTKGKAEAERAAQQARASLRIALSEKQKLVENVDGLKNVNTMLAAEARAPDPGCTMPPGVRQSIDGYIASLNAAPAVGAARDPSTGLPVEPAGTPAVLACVELANSVIDILQVAGGYIARDQSWREWSSRALQ